VVLGGVIFFGGVFLFAKSYFLGEVGWSGKSGGRGYPLFLLFFLSHNMVN